MFNEYIMIIDCQIAGISGDMFLSSLIDLGANKNKVTEAIKSCQYYLEQTEIKKVEFKKAKSNGFVGTKLYLEIEEKLTSRNGLEMYKNLSDCCDHLNLKQKSKVLVLNSFKTILKAEAKIHGQDIKKVHLHETSSIDTFVDLVGSAVALQDLDFLENKIVCTNIAVGNGITKFSHGLVSNPTNVVLEIFKNKPFVLEGAIEGELTTPTGAAILVNLVSECIEYYPACSIINTGYGIGCKQFKDFANTTKVTIGKAPQSLTYMEEKILLIETNVDDISGEILGNIIEKLSKIGVFDVSLISAITKKNRPATIIRVLADHQKKDIVLKILFNESGTGGIRIQGINRVKIPKIRITVPVIIENDEFMVDIDIKKDIDGDIISIKPEFDQIKEIANKKNGPIKMVHDKIMAQIIEKVNNEVRDF